jgi:hypothetical protein
MINLPAMVSCLLEPAEEDLRRSMLSISLKGKSKMVREKMAGKLTNWQNRQTS